MVKIKLHPNNFFNISILDLLVQKNLFKKGSEAYLYIGEYLQKRIIIKERKIKLYRHYHLDINIRRSRTRLEARIMKTILQEDIPIPRLFGVDINKFIIILEYIEGEPLGFLPYNDKNSSINSKSIFYKIGQLTAKLHNIKVIHGDLTPFNVLISPQNQIYFIDFGLSFFSSELEQQMMDLFTLKESLRAFSPYNYQDWFTEFLNGYESLVKTPSINQHLKSISQRGRYKIRTNN